MKRADGWASRPYRSVNEAILIREAAVFEGDAFGGEEVEFFGEGGAGAAALEAAGGQIGGDDAVAGDCGGEGIGAQGLADGAGGVATEAASERGVGDDLAGGDFAEGGVDFGGEGGGPGGRFKI